MKRILCFIIIICLCMTMIACETGDVELMGNYAAADSLVHNDVGAMIDADFAPMASQAFIVDVTQDMLTDDYVFDSDKTDWNGCCFVLNTTKNKLEFGYRMLNKVYPASITKLLTALITLKYCNMDEKVTISEEVAALSRGSNAELEEGDNISVYNLLLCLLTVSANNVGVALAEHIAGSEEAFVELMNEELKKIGCANTHFANAHGLHDTEHYTTPYDMYLVLQQCIKYEDFMSIMHVTKANYEYINAAGETVERTVETTNCFKLGKYELPEGITILSGKTGTTPNAGYCLMMEVENEKGTKYILAVYHAENEAKLYEKMYDLMTNYCTD